MAECIITENLAFGKKAYIRGSGILRKKRTSDTDSFRGRDAAGYFGNDAEGRTIA